MVNHILSVNQFDKERINKLFKITEQIELNYKRGPISLNPNKIMISFFGEPSTRTRFSFERAMFWLGGKVISESNSSNSSSLKKGESFKDTFKTLSQYGDLIVCRHSDENWINYAEYSKIPIINAGNGSDEHPTQSLLDLYTIYKECGRLNNLKIMFCGDLKYSRTVRSLLKLLDLFENNQIYMAPAYKIMTDWDYHKSPKYQELDEKEYYPKYNHIFYKETEDYLPEMDIIYFTRIQKERFLETSDKIEFFKLNEKHLTLLKNTAKIMHPLPRNDEISETIDNDDRAIYQEKQILNGVYIRIALLQELINESQF